MGFPAFPVNRRIVTAGLALFLALGAGVVMQHVLVDQTPLATRERSPDAAPLLRSADRPRALPTPPAATLVPMTPPPVLPNRVDRPQPAMPDLWDESRMSPFGFSCDPTLELRLAEAALIEVELFAPCDGNVRVALRHDALEVDVLTDALGRARAVLPALAPDARVEATMPERRVTAEINAPEAEAFSRVIVVAGGAPVFRMHAYELGAARGGSGHIWSGKPKTPARAVRGTGGFLFAVGDVAARSAEVYTFPTGHSPMRGVVELVVEASVTNETCGRLARATALQTSPLGGMAETEVRVTLPDCDAGEEVVVLKNMLRDMRLAGR